MPGSPAIVIVAATQRCVQCWHGVHRAARPALDDGLHRGMQCGQAHGEPMAGRLGGPVPAEQLLARRRASKTGLNRPTVANYL
ncbi:hypothetical protein Slala03_81380 [Streptomyces lavendulae subsp. lavendulae]|uniref:hypothetical protein n=1 Tax=Streptomyces lavendulae TaxID=1914 RepID=UPI0024A5C517|nr:hypothetical protein [Streptomyces lavendulae]GLV88449.1 hypothetical protein Slala03_81380 [Streptomyces lavendulae subsp. lavendulae]